LKLTTAPHTILISKSLAESRELATFCVTHQWTLVAESGISVTIHPFEQPENFDLLFFGSKNSAMSYFEQHTPPAHTNIACAGEATAKLVRFLGYSTSFVASTVNEEEVQRFAAWVGENFILVQTKV
jgi:uroporphyrinogen-III synthase